MRILYYIIFCLSMLCHGLSAATSSGWLDPKDDDIIFNLNTVKKAYTERKGILEHRQGRKQSNRNTQASADEYRVQIGALVIIEGDRGVGSGFVAKMNDKLFIVTNIHVIAANEYNHYRTVSGKVLKTQQRIFISKDRDLAIIPVEDHDDFLEIHQNIEVKMAIGDWVVVTGNSEGAAVVTKLIGKINGIGPDKVEIDAKFVEGNSGSPIIDPATGLVIAIATEVLLPDKRNPITRDSPYMKVRRFGYRIANNEQWESLTQDKLFEQNEIIEEFEERTDIMMTIFESMLKGNVPIGLKSHPTLGYIIERFDENYSYSNGRNSMRNIEAFQKLRDDLGFELERDIKIAEHNLSYAFFAGKLKDAIPYREFLAESVMSLDMSRK